MKRLSWLRMPESKRRYSPSRKAADGNIIVEPITDEIEAQLDRDQMSGRLGFEWVPPDPF